MVKVHWKIHHIPKSLYKKIREKCYKCRHTIRCLTYNHFMDQSYTADVCMEPIFWFVDNFTYALGPLFVVAVVLLTASVVGIAYWIGLPYWWERSPPVCVFLMIFGNWLLINIIFHYYKAVATQPGYPPQGELITEAVSICKKCIAPKPPRTHHCSVCNRCILKMDHHCPWLNNCVGYANHRHFYLYMVFMVVGTLFLIIFGFDLAYQEIWLTPDYSDEPELEGHPVKFNKTGAMIPVTELFNPLTNGYQDEEYPSKPEQNPWRRRSIIYMALINTGVLLALGGLALWHGRLIASGETSIESNINVAETKRLSELGKIYVNPYNFGKRKNWRIFLGLVQQRSWFWHVFLPSKHHPVGDGLTWPTIHDNKADEWP